MTTLIDLVYASPLFFLILFIGLQRFEKRRLINGIVFNFFLFSALMDAALIVIRLNNETLNNIAIAAAIVVVLIVMFFYLFGIVLLLWNAYIVWKKRKSHVIQHADPPHCVSHHWLIFHPNHHALVTHSRRC